MARAESNDPSGDDYARAQAAMSRMMFELPIEGKRSTTPDLALLKSPQQLALEQNMLGEKGVDTQVLKFFENEQNRINWKTWTGGCTQDIVQQWNIEAIKTEPSQTLTDKQQKVHRAIAEMYACKSPEEFLGLEGKVYKWTLAGNLELKDGEICDVPYHVLSKSKQMVCEALAYINMRNDIL